MRFPILHFVKEEICFAYGICDSPVILSQIPSGNRADKKRQLNIFIDALGQVENNVRILGVINTLIEGTNL